MTIAPREIGPLLRSSSALVLLSALLACSSTPAVKLRVDSTANINDQRSVYLLVRTVQEADYRMESYDEVAAKVVQPDDSIEHMAVALPGVSLTFTLKEPPPKKRVAIYAMFERPVCGGWRVLLPEKRSSDFQVRLYEGRLCLVGADGQCITQGCGGTEVASTGAETAPQ
jgi:hypothetical protein